LWKLRKISGSPVPKRIALWIVCGKLVDNLRLFPQALILRYFYPHFEGSCPLQEQGFSTKRYRFSTGLTPEMLTKIYILEIPDQRPLEVNWL